jgi:hypothetical protein
MFKNINCMDFVTIVFNDPVEIQLLKMQAFSFQFVEPSLIHRILVVFNEPEEMNQEFNSIFQNLLYYYPPHMRYKVHLVLLKDIGLTIIGSNWYTQQIVKLQISKIIDVKYYVVLDAKNHFIKKIKKTMFFNSDEKPYLYINDAGDIFGTFYNNCFAYFNTTCPNADMGLGRLRIQTITPFLFIAQECRNLIGFVEAKEQKSFKDFFIESKKYTEFYFYYSYLSCCKKNDLYAINLVYTPFVTVGDQDPKTNVYNSWNSIKNVMETQNIYVFSLHRRCLSILDQEYKKNLIDFYTSVFKNHNMIKDILYFLYT